MNEEFPRIESALNKFRNYLFDQKSTNDNHNKSISVRSLDLF